MRRGKNKSYCGEIKEMKVWVITDTDLDEDGEGNIHAEKYTIKVVDSEEKAKQICDYDMYKDYKEFKVE